MKKIKEILPTRKSHLGGQLENRTLGGLKKFNKNRKAKRIVIGSIVGVILLIGGITLYRTFALYEEKKEFDVIKGQIQAHPIINSIGQVTMTNGTPKKGEGYSGVSVSCGGTTQATWNNDTWEINFQSGAYPKTCTVEFWNTEFYNLITTAGIPLTVKTFDQILANTDYVNKIVTNKSAMELVVNSDYLSSGIKDSGNYSTEVRKLFLNSTVVSEDKKYNVGLPCYVFYANKDIPDFVGGFDSKTTTRNYNGTNYKSQALINATTDSTYYGYYQLQAVGSATNGQGSLATIYTNNQINTNSYKYLEIDSYYGTNLSNNALTCTASIGFANSSKKETTVVGTTCNTILDECNQITYKNGKDNVMTEVFTYAINLKGMYHLKIHLFHQNSKLGNCNLYVKSIALY